MDFRIIATSVANDDASISVKESLIAFGTTEATADQLPNPAELFLGAFAACMLKNVERFSGLLHFDYDRAQVKVEAARLQNPTRMDEIKYELTIYSKDERLRVELLRKNIEKFGTIYNTVKQSCSIDGEIRKEIDYV